MDELLNVVDDAINGIGQTQNKEAAVAKVRKVVHTLASGVFTKPSQKILEALKTSDRIPKSEQQDAADGKLGTESVEYYIKKQVAGTKNEKLIELESGNIDDKIIIGIKNFKEDRLTLSMVLDKLGMEIGLAVYDPAALTPAQIAALDFKWCNHAAPIPPAVLASEIVMLVNNAEVFRAPIGQFITNEPFIFNRLEDAKGGLDVANRLLTPNDQVQFQLDTPAGVSSWGTAYRYVLRLGLRGSGYTRRLSSTNTRT